MLSAMRVACIALFATLLVVLSCASASAWCVYNHTDKTLRVRGGTCFGCFDGEIKPEQQTNNCCPGDSKGCGGSPNISILASSFHDMNTVGGVFQKIGCGQSITRPYYVFFARYPAKSGGGSEHGVPAHGWISIYAKPYKDEKELSLYGLVKDKDGKVLWEGFALPSCGAAD